MSVKLTQKQIHFIDNHLQFIGVKFIDVRIELLDHLVFEFENKEADESLEDFLKTKKIFIRDFKKNLHNKRHWGYQKALLKRFLMFLYVPKYLIISFLFITIFSFLIPHFNTTPIKFLFLSTIIIPQILQFFIYYISKGLHKKIQSFQYIFSIMSGPSLFLFFFNPISEWLLENPFYFLMYWFLAFAFNAAGIIEVIKCKKKTLSIYRQIIS